MNRKRFGRTVYLAVFWMVVLAALLVTATYAWFTFSPYTKVTPMSSTVGTGDASLLIANQENGQFDKECALTPDSLPEILSPLSTVDLNKFYVATAQNRNGISILFSDASAQADSMMIHGRVYLKCENGNCQVFLRRSGFNLGQDGQALAALRLGLVISTSAGQHTYILKLDELGNTANAAAQPTVPTSGTVVSSVDSVGNASFVTDPAVSMADYFALEESAEDTQPGAGKMPLCELQSGEVAPVEYWLYLEGCDDNCIGDVQQKDIGLQLSFAGVPLD